MEFDERNPSPPPEYDGDAASTAIGNTTFSRSWLFQCLLDAIKEVEAEASRHQNDENEMTNLSEELEERLCTLWDMSANEEVSGFLQEFKAPEMFVQMIGSTTSPRLLEIIVGILGNMCTFDGVNRSVTNTDSMTRVCLWLLGSTDTPTLLQIIRLLQTCLANDCTSQAWIDSIIDNLAPTVDHLQTILCNSLNGDLLTSTLKLVEMLSNAHPEISLALTNVDFVRALDAAALQFLTQNDVLKRYWRIIYNLDSETRFGEILDSCFEDFIVLLKAYLASIPDEAGRESRYILLEAPYAFLSRMSDKARHLFLDDSVISECTFRLLQEIREPLPEDETLRETLQDSLVALTRGITK